MSHFVIISFTFAINIWNCKETLWTLCISPMPTPCSCQPCSTRGCKSPCLQMISKLRLNQLIKHVALPNFLLLPHSSVDTYKLFREISHLHFQCSLENGCWRFLQMLTLTYHTSYHHYHHLPEDCNRNRYDSLGCHFISHCFLASFRLIIWMLPALCYCLPWLLCRYQMSR
jgi:hypothetical protein